MFCKIWWPCPHSLPLITSIYSLSAPASPLFIYYALFHPNLLESAPCYPHSIAFCPTLHIICYILHIYAVLFHLCSHSLTLPFIHIHSLSQITVIPYLSSLKFSHVIFLLHFHSLRLISYFHFYFLTLHQITLIDPHMAHPSALFIDFGPHSLPYSLSAPSSLFFLMLPPLITLISWTCALYYSQTLAQVTYIYSLYAWLPPFFLNFLFIPSIYSHSASHYLKIFFLFLLSLFG